MKVAKFGGTSMASGETFAMVARKALSDKDIRAVVVSAGGKTEKYGKVTDLLIKAAEGISGGGSYEKLISPLKERLSLLKEKTGVGIDVDEELTIIGRELLKGAPPDFLVSRGEYLYAKFFAAYIGWNFLDAAKVMKFYDDGRFNLEYSCYLIDEYYESHGNFVMGGFYGSDAKGNIRVFARGGSDYSGAVVARALKAEKYLNFTDVDGISSFDPAETGIRKILAEISFTEVRRLGEFGASVLYPDCLLPLMGTGIKTVVLNTFSDSEGTEITERGEAAFCGAIKDGLKRVRVKKYGANELVSIPKSVPSLVAADSDGADIICERVDEFLVADRVKEENGISLLYLSDCEKSFGVLSMLVSSGVALSAAKYGEGYFVAFESENRKKVVGEIIRAID